MAGVGIKRRKLKITAKDILCFPAYLLSSWVNTINPKRIAKSYIQNFKEHKVAWVAVLAFIAFVGLRIAFMDFDLSVFGINNTIFAGGTQQEIEDMLAIDLGSYHIEQIYDAFVPAGVALAVLYWLIMFVGMAVRDQFTVEQIAMHLIRLIVPVWLICDKGYDILNFLIQTGDGVRGDLMNILTVGGHVGDENAGDLKVSLFNLLNALVPLFCLWIIGMACKIVMMLTCFMRRLKILILTALAPLALADVTGDQHSTSMRYLKNLLALALQGAMIVAMGKMALFILANECGNVGGTSIVKLVADGQMTIAETIPVVAIGLTVISIYPRTEEIAKTLIGA